MAVIDHLRLKDMFLFLHLHGTGNVIIHDGRGLHLAGAVAAMVEMISNDTTVGTAVSWLL